MSEQKRRAFWRRGTTGQTADDAGTPGPRPSVAVLTVARDEAVMLPRWVAHYGAQVGPENLIVFDDNSVDGSTDDLPCTVHRIPGFPPAKFEGHRIRMVSGVAKGLLETYDWVIFTDVDEFLLTDPARYPDLPALLADRPDAPALGAVGLQVVHHTGLEGPLDPDRPVLDQRGFVSFAPVMCKPSVKRVGAPWAHASHGLRRRYAVDPALFMLHLKFADRDLLKAVAEHRNALVAMDSRGANTTWSKPGEEVIASLEELTRDLDVDALEEFDPARLDLDSLVMEFGKTWRTRKQGQISGLFKNGVVRLPERLRGLL